ncbi:LysR family transcriptional regulator [Clostridium fessum]|uniref:LysR family transcriptional regulator n=1 Tax=Clostridium fessum TaxID=2126740 RepID=UPI002A833EDD|nr:LysR family transcriptional regulator [Clostridium fessum]MDY4928130.1 LysR family transcriptional regulator [Clostridium fessum]
MDQNTIEYFLLVAKLEHISKAAEVLNITQPTLSYSIQRLETELGYPLFDRPGRHIRLNENGKIFYQAMLQCKEIYENAHSQMEQLALYSSRSFTLSCSNSSVNSMLIDKLIDNGISLKLHHLTDDWPQTLTAKSNDLVITMEESDDPSFFKKKLQNLNISFVTSKNHPLASQKELTLAKATVYPFCIETNNRSMINLVQRSHPELNWKPTINFYGRNSNDSLKAILSGKSIGLMVSRNLLNRDDLCFLNVSDCDFTLPIYVYALRNAAKKKPLLLVIIQEIYDFYQNFPC